MVRIGTSERAVSGSKYIEEDLITNSMVLVRLLLIWIRHFNAVGVVVNRPITLENCTSLHC